MTEIIVRLIKDANKLTQAQLAETIGFSRYTVIKAEKGKFGPRVRRGIEGFLGHSLDSLALQAALAVLKGDPGWRKLFKAALDEGEAGPVL